MSVDAPILAASPNGATVGALRAPGS
jgi:hypothetical protein